MRGNASAAAQVPGGIPVREAREWDMNIAKQGVLPAAWFGAMTKEHHGRKIQLNRLENVANLVHGVMLSLLSHRAKILNIIFRRRNVTIFIQSTHRIQ